MAPGSARYHISSAQPEFSNEIVGVAAKNRPAGFDDDAVFPPGYSVDVERRGARLCLEKAGALFIEVDRRETLNGLDRNMAKIAQRLVEGIFDLIRVGQDSSRNQRAFQRNGLVVRQPQPAH